jgi:hypothetical protein
MRTRKPPPLSISHGVEISSGSNLVRLFHTQFSSQKIGELRTAFAGLLDKT